MPYAGEIPLRPDLKLAPGKADLCFEVALGRLGRELALESDMVD